MITIVSGLPRSGTSLMMQMLGAGGMSVLTDFKREPDIDNPRGYCEWEGAKHLPEEPNRIDEAEGKAVKIISQLLLFIPRGRSYKLIFMERPLPEVIASQDMMLKRRDTTDSTGHLQLEAAFRRHLRDVIAWIEERDDIDFCRMGYRKILQDPIGSASILREFLEVELDLEAMARQVDQTLYRSRLSSAGRSLPCQVIE